MTGVERMGSPPQVRGKPSSGALADAAGGITPAGAGKTVFTPAATWASRDHPRRCGENFFHFLPHRIKKGSPPQVRGKPKLHQKAPKSPRITPAGAGKTASCSLPSRPLKDHPRRCGENRPIFMSVAKNDGITPAGAGKTCCDRVAAW